MDTTRERIIVATVKCIVEGGLHAISSRRIAKAAGVNIAAINYYFGSQDKLIDAAIQRSMDDYLSEILDGPEDEAADPDSVLRKLLSESLKDAVASPNTLKSFLYDALTDNDYEGAFIEKLNTFLTRISGPRGSDAEARGSKRGDLRIAHEVASILFVSLFPRFFERFLGMDFRDPRNQALLIDSVIDDPDENEQSVKMIRASSG